VDGCPPRGDLENPCYATPMRFELPMLLSVLLASVGCSGSSSDDAADDSSAASTGGASSTGPSGTSGSSGPTSTTQGPSTTATSTSGSTTTNGATSSGGPSGTGGPVTSNVTGTTGTTGSATTGGSGGSTGSGDTTSTTSAGGSGGGGTECEPATSPGRVCIKGKQYYLNGINVAWDQWVGDLTNYNPTNFETMFATLEASGGNAIRWWWFIDGENQLTFDGNLAQPLPQNVFDNLDVAFEAAAEHGVLIMPVLLSFDIENSGRTYLVTDPAATDAFVSNVVTPLVQRYNDHPALGLWEIMNEGDWLLASESGTVSTEDYQRFHAKVAAGIHAADADALVTTGSASFKYLESANNILSDAALQAAAGGDAGAYLDVYQTHYYGWMHGDGWSYEPWIKSSSEWQADGKPVLIGEFPCRGEDGRWTSMQMHVESVNQGFAGTFCWAFFDNRADSEGTWQNAQPGVEAIAAQIPGAITGE